MLQQTTVAAVVPYFQRFLELWPRLEDLAKADPDDILKAWAGLGYYARARNLHKCAAAVMNDHDGVFPDTVEGLRKLPGIGTYTAAAIGAIAFGQAAVPVDGNVIRVLARLHGVSDPMPAKKAVIETIATAYAAPGDAGDFAQGLMELGAVLCKDRGPDCGSCPVSENCVALRRGDPEAFPVKSGKKARPTRRGWVFWIEDGRGRVLIRRRPEKGLLGGMMELPGTDWLEKPPTSGAARDMSPIDADLEPVAGSVTHAFTHFQLVLRAMAARLDVPANPPADCRWHPIETLFEEALPTVMRKAAQLARIAFSSRK